MPHVAVQLVPDGRVTAKPISLKRWAHSDMPSFSSHWAICCIAAPYGLNAIPTGPKVYHARQFIAAAMPTINLFGGGIGWMDANVIDKMLAF
jgi:hypothetical protein